MKNFLIVFNKITSYLITLGCLVIFINELVTKNTINHMAIAAFLGWFLVVINTK
jgi:hypothetical protein